MEKRCSNCKHTTGKNVCIIGGKIPEGAYFGCIEAAYTYFEPENREEVNAKEGSEQDESFPHMFFL